MRCPARKLQKNKWKANEGRPHTTLVEVIFVPLSLGNENQEALY
jgi:hypothetical protein